MTGAVGAVIALLVSKLVEVHHPYWTLAGGVAIFGAFIMAIRARTPRMSYFPVSPRGLLTVAEKPSGEDRNAKQHEVESVIAASYHVAIAVTMKICEWKNQRVKESIWMFYVGFGLLVRSLLI